MKVSHCRFMIYKKLRTLVFCVRDRFSQNYKMHTWSGFCMTCHIYHNNICQPHLNILFGPASNELTNLQSM